MNPDRAAYAAQRLGNARTALREVDILVDNMLWNVAVNRLYYACFYAVTALLHSYGYDTKTHAGTQRLFSLYFIKTGIINETFGNFYTVLLEMRQDADYEAGIDYDEQDVRKLLPSAKEFVDKVESLLSNS